MIFAGEETFAHPVEEVWNALHDLNLLKRALPGCRSISAIGDGQYAVALSLGVAAVKGEYEGRVRLTDIKRFAHYNIEGEGKGAPGFVRLRMDCWFESQGSGTLMRWKCDATVGGLIASIGGKVLSGISKFMAQQFFKALRDELNERTTGHTEHVVTTLGSVSRHGSNTLGPARANWFTRFWRGIVRALSRTSSN
jgi:carbon monoxide dehydrogenase subunit G